MKNLLIVGLAFVLPLTLASEEKKTINVKAVSSRSHTNEYTSNTTTLIAETGH